MKIRTHNDLEVYKLAFEAAMEIFEISKKFPVEEKYSLTDQIRRSSRSVSANLAEAFRKRKYPKAFVSKLTDSEGEAAETQVWLDFAMRCQYIDNPAHKILFENYQSKKDQTLEKQNDIEKLSTKELITIGVAQSLAVIPGVSRSGAVIVCGRALNWSRELITEFSFHF